MRTYKLVPFLLSSFRRFNFIGETGNSSMAHRTAVKNRDIFDDTAKNMVIKWTWRIKHTIPSDSYVSTSPIKISAVDCCCIQRTIHDARRDCYCTGHQVSSIQYITCWYVIAQIYETRLLLYQRERFFQILWIKRLKGPINWDVSSRFFIIQSVFQLDLLCIARCVAFASFTHSPVEITGQL